MNRNFLSSGTHCVRNPCVAQVAAEFGNLAGYSWRLRSAPCDPASPARSRQEEQLPPEAPLGLEERMFEDTDSELF